MVCQQCLFQEEAMSHTPRWVLAFSVATLATAAVALHFAPSQLSQSQLTTGPLPHVPAQPIRATMECVGGRDISVVDIGRDWSFIQDHPPCAVGGVVLAPIKATVAEIPELTQRPMVTFKLSASGLASEGRIVRSSGSKTLDERALTQVMTTRYPHQNCGICKLSTAINIEFQGSVWFRDTGPAR